MSPHHENSHQTDTGPQCLPGDSRNACKVSPFCLEIRCEFGQVCSRSQGSHRS